jgi:SnoaL-like domain
MERLSVLFASVAVLWTVFAPSTQAADVKPDVYEQVRNHVTCYPFGLDKIGAGDVAAGKEIWKSCFAKDYTFAISIPGMGTVVCPGEKCPLPKEMDSVSMRAAFARHAYDMFKFARTNHHLTNITITSATDESAEVKSYLMAWHQRVDHSVLVSTADWNVAVAKKDGNWLISREDLKINFEGVMQAPEPAPK